MIETKICVPMITAENKIVLVLANDDDFIYGNENFCIRLEDLKNALDRLFCKFVFTTHNTDYPLQGIELSEMDWKQFLIELGLDK